MLYVRSTIDRQDNALLRRSLRHQGRYGPHWTRILLVGCNFLPGLHDLGMANIGAAAEASTSKIPGGISKYATLVLLATSLLTMPGDYLGSSAYLSCRCS